MIRIRSSTPISASVLFQGWEYLDGISFPALCYLCGDLYIAHCIPIPVTFTNSSHSVYPTRYIFREIL